MTSILIVVLPSAFRLPPNRNNLPKASTKLSSPCAKKITLIRWTIIITTTKASTTTHPRQSPRYRPYLPRLPPLTTRWVEVTSPTPILVSSTSRLFAVPLNVKVRLMAVFSSFLFSTPTLQILTQEWSKKNHKLCHNRPLWARSIWRTRNASSWNAKGYVTEWPLPSAANGSSSESPSLKIKLRTLRPRTTNYTA